MKIKCSKTTLVEALNVVTKAVPARSTMPILTGIHLVSSANGTLVLTASDLEISIQKNVEAVVEAEGSVVVTAKLFNDIIRKMPDETIVIDCDANKTVHIKSGKSRFKLVGFPADDFPEFAPEEENTAEVYFERDIFKSMVRRTAFAASSDEARGNLTGILTEIKDNLVKMVALDGYRLALVNQQMDGRGDYRFVISAKIMNEICKIIDAEAEATDLYITLGKRKAFLEIGGTKIILRLMEGDFIKYNSIIPDEGTTNIITRRKMLLDAIERASLFAKEGRNNLIKMDIGANELVITSQSEEGAVDEQVPTQMMGDKFIIGFNSKFVMDTLRAMDDDEITMQLNGPTSPCVISTTESDKCKYLVLPVRI